MGSKRHTNETFIKAAQKVHGNKFDYSKVRYKGAHSKIELLCRVGHGVFIQKPNAHLNGNGCPACSILRRAQTHRKPIEDFIKKAIKKHGKKYDYSKVGNERRHDKATIICRVPGHGAFRQTLNDHLAGCGCQKCGLGSRRSKRTKSKAAFLKEAKAIHGTKYDYSLVEYRNALTKITINCPTHGEFKQTPASHLWGRGCSACSECRRLTIEEAEKRHPDLVKGQKWVSVQSKYAYVCEKHGQYEQNFANHDKGARCPRCISSRGERSVRKYLEENAIPFSEQARLIVGTRYRFDFYLHEARTVIEYQGQQHFFPVDFTSRGKQWAEAQFKNNQKRDRFKRAWAKQNGYHLIEIRFDEDVDTVLTRELGLKKAA